MDLYTAGREHGGVLIETIQREYKHIRDSKKFLEQIKMNQGNIIVLLDKIIDPQNFGSIVRTCFYYGVDCVITNKQHRPALSPSVTRVSLGASESIELYTTNHFKSLIEQAKSNNWKIITTTVKPERKEKNYIPLYKLKLNKRDNIMIILGSEGEGLAHNIQEYSDYNVFIPHSIQTDSLNSDIYKFVDSMNVAVSAGIIINNIKKQLI